MRKYILIVLVLFCFSGNAQRIGNYVANGSFEEYYICQAPPFIQYIVKNWGPPDSLTQQPLFMSICNGFVPTAGGGGSVGAYQYPHSGNSYILPRFYRPFPINSIWRVYSRNRMKATLQAGKTYCVKFYVNNYNGNPCGISAIGAYFGGSEVDTIHYCNIPLTYLTPQVQNPQGNIITDTLNWVAITGTFTANGTEKYLMLGNFLSDEDTDTLIINPTHLPTVYTNLGIDDVSCIEMNLPAYAGRDTTILNGDSVYIGREKDFATDPYCVWYKLPDTANAIDTTSGLWVKPSVTTTYVVKQELECSSLKWDTVVVNVGYVGIEEYVINNLQVELYPNPANDLIKIECKTEYDELTVSIYDVTGRIILTEKVKPKNHAANMKLDLPNGMYFVNINTKQNGNVAKKLIISK